MTKIVGFTGRKRSGKNTAADVFAHAGYQHLSFASPIKAMLYILLQIQGLSHVKILDMLEGNSKELPSPFLGGRSPRHCMQTLGTQWGRQLISDTIWVDTLMMTAKQFPAVVVSDVRFPNEVAAIKAAGGVVYRVVRPGLIANDDHESEAHIDALEVDGELINSAPSAAEFQLEVATLLGSVGTGVQ